MYPDFLKRLDTLNQICPPALMKQYVFLYKVTHHIVILCMSPRTSILWLSLSLSVTQKLTPHCLNRSKAQTPPLTES